VLFGGLLARTGLNRKSALATAALVLSAEAPDLDVIAGLGGRAVGFAQHRGFTHTFLGLPVMAAVVLVVLWIYWRGWGQRKQLMGEPPPRWARLYLLAILGGLSHLLLDFTNNYGVRPFAPFSGRWYAWDIVAIAEPVLWVLLLGGLLLPPLFRLLRGAIGRRRLAPVGRGGALIALLLIFCFWGFRDYQHRRALAAVEALRYQGQPPRRVSAGPYARNPFRWYAVAETPDFYEMMLVDTRRPQAALSGPVLRRDKSPDTPVTLAARNSYLGRAYVSWARYPVLESEPLSGNPGGYLVRFRDLRYAYPDLPQRRGILGAWVWLDGQLRVAGQGMGRAASPRECRPIRHSSG
jgi:inner membrane protein